MGNDYSHYELINGLCFHILSLIGFLPDIIYQPTVWSDHSWSWMNLKVEPSVAEPEGWRLYRGHVALWEQLAVNRSYLKLTSMKISHNINGGGLYNLSSIYYNFLSLLWEISIMSEWNFTWWKHDGWDNSMHSPNCFIFLLGIQLKYIFHFESKLGHVVSSGQWNRRGSNVQHMVLTRKEQVYFPYILSLPSVCQQKIPLWTYSLKVKMVKL